MTGLNSKNYSDVLYYFPRSFTSRITSEKKNHFFNIHLKSEEKLSAILVKFFSKNRERSVEIVQYITSQRMMMNMDGSLTARHGSPFLDFELDLSSGEIHIQHM